MGNAFSTEKLNQLEKLAQRLGIEVDELLDRLIDIRSDELFYMKKYHDKKYQSGEGSVDLKRIGILGCQSIARGIAKLMALKGVKVVMYDDSAKKLNRTMELFDQNLDWMIYKWELTGTEKKLILQQIRTTSNINDLNNCDMIFDTLRGDYADRLNVYEQLTTIIGSDVIIAINDDTCMISRFAIAISNPERVVGCHFTYPASMRKVVEIMRGEKTSTHTMLRIINVLRFLGKEFIEVVESPGAISSRIMIPFINEAIGLWIEGIASAEEIDHTMKLAMNLEMGPLEFADTLGLDVVLHTMERLWQTYGLSQFRPHARLRHLVIMGFLGKKTGRGIHVYDVSELGEVS